MAGGPAPPPDHPAPESPAPEDPQAAARHAWLVYVSDRDPGLRRLKHRSGFRYVDPDGRPVRDADALERIHSLAIPPAWTDVWICPRAEGHLQATGHDARGRKQYRYHPRWTQVRDETKFHRLTAFARALPRLRDRVRRDLAKRGLTRDRVLATAVGVMQGTLIRVGGEEYARDNDSYGAATLRGEHVDVEGSTIRLHFPGKSGKVHEVAHRDRRLARIVRACQDLPGQELFGWVDDAGAVHDVGSADINAYMQDAAGDSFSAKDFRTWAGTVLAARELAGRPPPDTRRALRGEIRHAMDAVAACLGNTAAVCRKGYVHPAILERFAAGDLAELDLESGPGAGVEGLDAAENAVLAFLERRETA